MSVRLFLSRLSLVDTHTNHLHQSVSLCKKLCRSPLFEAARERAFRWRQSPLLAYLVCPVQELWAISVHKTLQTEWTCYGLFSHHLARASTLAKFIMWIMRRTKIILRIPHVLSHIYGLKYQYAPMFKITIKEIMFGKHKIRLHLLWQGWGKCPLEFHEVHERWHFCPMQLHSFQILSW